VLATAHPAKFPEAVAEATGVTPETPAALAAFETAPKRVERLAATSDALRAALLERPDFSA
jgi:threonine synthase